MQDPEQYYDPPGGLLSLDIKEGQRKSDHLLLLDLAKPKSAEGPEVDLAALEARMAQVMTLHHLDSSSSVGDSDFVLMLGN